MMAKKVLDDWKIWTMVIFGLSSVKYMFIQLLILVTCTQSHGVREKKLNHESSRC